MPEQMPIAYTGFEVSFRSMTGDIAAKMQVSSLFDASGDRKVTALLFDAILHTDFQERVDLPDGFSYYKKKGSGLRIALKATGLDVKASLGFASVAAQATLGKASAEYRVHGFGLSDDIIGSLLTVPLSGTLSSDTYLALQQTINSSWPAYLRSNHVGLSEYAVPIPSIQDDPGERARAVNYAASMIAQKKSLAFANAHRPKGISPAIVTLIFARFLGSVSSHSDTAPSSEHAAQANHWLATGAIQSP